MKNTIEHDVALSFAGEDRTYVVSERKCAIILYNNALY
jgi:hypothetical protein